MAGRVLKNDHIGAVKNFIKARKEYNKKLQADVEWDDLYDKEFNRLVDSDPKAKSLRKKMIDSGNEMNKSSTRLGILEQNGVNHSDPKKYDSAYEKYEKDYDAFYDHLDRYHDYTGRYNEMATSLADSTIKAKYGYTKSDFRESKYAQKALIDKGAIKYKRQQAANAS